jgi:hypothetical protein
VASVLEPRALTVAPRVNLLVTGCAIESMGQGEYDVCLFKSIIEVSE